MNGKVFIFIALGGDLAMLSHNLQQCIDLTSSKSIY